jgi:Resolvase, N terminal domain
MEEHRPSAYGAARTVYHVDAQFAAELARECVYVEQARSGKIGARQRPLFEQMKRDAAARKFDRLLVWKVSRLGRDMREVISTVDELADLGVTVVPVKSQTGPISSTMGKLLWAIQAYPNHYLLKHDVPEKTLLEPGESDQVYFILSLSIKVQEQFG